MPWVHEDNPGPLKILNVARYDHEPVNECCGGDDRIGFIAAIWNM
ncbi:hypothetical protein SAMN03159496_05535 [Rhizobium sp. NFR07]|nr:hypothetical protein SAMN03159496_05535 [Rhizobium sp. NFR07]